MEKQPAGMKVLKAIAFFGTIGACVLILIGIVIIVLLATE